MCVFPCHSKTPFSVTSLFHKRWPFIGAALLCDLTITEGTTCNFVTQTGSVHFSLYRIWNWDWEDVHLAGIITCREHKKRKINLGPGEGVRGKREKKLYQKLEKNKVLYDAGLIGSFYKREKETWKYFSPHTREHTN